MRRTLRLLCIGLAMCIPILTNAQLTANFTANTTSGCSPIVVQFNDLSTGGPTSWAWNLGNGTFSSQQNPSTTYLNPGTYTVVLTVSNAGGSNTKTITNYITVLPSPQVNFVANDSSASCPPKVVQFTNLSVPGSAGAATYYWDFGDGNTSGLSNPSHTYLNAGNYNVTLVVTNSNGCTKSFVKPNYIPVLTKPHADFTATNNNTCTVPATVSFTNSSTGATSYLWNFGDGTTSTTQNVSHTYNTAGSYTITLIATNASGCSDTMIKPAYVNIGNLSAQFTMSATTACTGNNINFINTSLPGPGNSTWYFGDGTTATTANATHAYTTSGTYTVKLVVQFNNCTDSTTHTITINQGAQAHFTGAPTSGCNLPFTVQFNNTTTGATGYQWLFGDGGTSTAVNPSHSYTANGNYTVTLIATSANGCADTLIRNNYIHVAPATATIAATPNSGCAPITINFTSSLNSPNTLSTFSWNFGDGGTNTTSANPGHIYTVPGAYTVTFTYTTTTGCTGSVQTTVNIGSHPTAAFTAAPTTICPDHAVVFTNNSSGATTYTWLFGDGSTSTATNPTHIYSAQGVYTVTLIANNGGCRDTLIIPNMITVLPPTANFHFTLNCANKLHYDFTNTSIGADTYFWSFGDGTTSTIANPSHTYATYGGYYIQLVVTNAATGCTDTTGIVWYIFPTVAQFTANNTNICKNNSVTFTAQSSPYYSYYSWDYGDGSPVQVVSTNTVSHIYTTPGTYNVKLLVTDMYGCQDSLTRPAYIHVGGPTVNFTGTPTNGCSPLTVNFQDLSSVGGTTITSRTWRFGDGSILTGNVTNPAHTYTGAGSYTVTLVATDALGCTDSLVKPNYITVTKPSAHFSSTDTAICPSQNANFINASTGNGPLTYSWSFGDGGSSTTANPGHIYSLSGVYTVTLIVTDASGCKDTLIRPAYIHVNTAHTHFNMSDSFATCPPLAVNFTNTSTGVTSYNWTFGNGSTSTLSNPSTVYTYPGVYHITLIGQNAAGCIDSYSRTVTVLGPTGTFSYSPLSGCSPLTVHFTSTNQNTQSITWDMNNGVTQTTSGSTFNYTYTQPGNYVPIIVLSDGASCLVSVRGIDTIRVGQLAADFTFAPTTLCQSGTVQFFDTAYGTTTGLIRNWTFGDGGTSTAHNPSHNYSAPGTYTVTLIIGNATGCVDTIHHIVNVYPAPTVTVGGGQAICLGQNTTVQLQASGAATYVWTPSGTLSCNNCPNPVASPTTSTTYTVTGTDIHGCSSTAQVTVTINQPPIVNAGNNQTICQGASTPLQATGAANYTWSPTTGLSCTNCANPIATPAATTTYTVIGTSINGCSDTTQVTVTVNPKPTVNAGANQAICSGGTVQMQATGTAQTYSWLPATGLSCTNCANPVANPTATTTYTVTGTSANGCTNTSQVMITVNPLPVIDAGQNQSICIGNTAQLNVTGAATYSWAPSTGLSCTTCPNPIATLNTTTTYTITGTSVNGCVNASQVTVTVNPLPVITAGADQTICGGSSAQLQAAGGLTYSWSPSTGLSCTNCDNPVASPGATTTYTVTGTNTNGCSNTAQVTVNINPVPPVNAGPDQSICKGGSVQLQASGAVSYSWSPATGLSCVTCDNPLANPANPTVYTVTGTGANGCTATDDVMVSIYTQPVIDAGPDQTICNGNTAHLLATGGSAYLWSPAAGLSCTACPDPSVNISNSTTYTVVGTDIHGCQDSDKVSFTVIQKQPTSVSANDTICEGETAQIAAFGGTGYTWLPPTGLNNNQVSDPTATPANTTTYMAIIQQQNCFADTAYVTVVVNPNPRVSAGPDQHIIAGNTAQIKAEGTNIATYNWTPSNDLSCTDCPNPQATPAKTTTYTVDVASEFGCKAKDDITIFVTCDNSQIFIPNTFTPNGDGDNDRFYPSGKGISVIKRFSVYNRWGELMFQTSNIAVNDPLSGWDGTFKGQQLKPDVFVYIIDATCETGDPLQFKGDISLIR